MRKRSKLKLPFGGPGPKALILIALAIILGLAIFNQQKLKSSPASSTPPQPLPSTLTGDERFILSPPPADASRSAKDKHAQTVAKLAKTSDTLEINDCQPTPLVLQVKQDSEFTISNKDNVKHRIIIDQKHIYELPANNSLNIKADFKYGAGDYGYVCEGVGLTGFLHIVP